MPLQMGQILPRARTAFRWIALAFVLAAGLINFADWFFYDHTWMAYTQLLKDPSGLHFMNKLGGLQALGSWWVAGAFQATIIRKRSVAMDCARAIAFVAAAYTILALWDETRSWFAYWVRGSGAGFPLGYFNADALLYVSYPVCFITVVALFLGDRFTNFLELFRWITLAVVVTAGMVIFADNFTFARAVHYFFLYGLKEPPPPYMPAIGWAALAASPWLLTAATQAVTIRKGWLGMDFSRALALAAACFSIVSWGPEMQSWWLAGYGPWGESPVFRDFDGGLDVFLAFPTCIVTVLIFALGISTGKLAIRRKMESPTQ